MDSLQRVTTKLNEVVKEYNMIISCIKMKMVRNEWTQSKGVKIVIEGEFIEQMPSFKFLG
jgi:adenylyl- and sulfurtransferase ThiI